MPRTLRQIVYDAVLEAMGRNGNSRALAAKELGINRRTITRMVHEMRNVGMDVPLSRREPGYIPKSHKAKLHKKFRP